MIQWTPSLSVGVDIIDQQHRELIERIHALVQSIREGKCRNTIGGLIDFLQEYVIFHFREEEMYMRQQKYPRLSEHMNQHAEFLRSIEALRKDLDRLMTEGGSSYELSVATNQVVVEWIMAHIARTDRMFGDYLKERAQDLNDEGSA